MSIKKITALFALSIALGLCASAQDAYTVITNPGEDAAHQARINWHADLSSLGTITYTRADDPQWANPRTLQVRGQLITAFDSIWSKSPDNQNFWEYPHFHRYVAQLDSLEPATEYIYRIGDDPDVRRFKTGPLPGDDFTAAVISDFHVYPPISGRLESAMNMLDTLQAVNGDDFDLLLHVGDITAWGGSYSFWRQLYDRPAIRNHAVAGVIGNHDHMTRYFENNRWVAAPTDRSSNQYFRYANANPENGYEGEIGVCYWFRYGDVLFIMLNNEAMHTDEGLEAAQDWVRWVVEENPANKIVVMEHYQWFDGVNGRTSQYERWHQLFDELGVTLAIAGNNHVYVRSLPIKDDKTVAPGEGTVYLQTPSCDNDRGQILSEQTDNFDRIASRWSEGRRTVGALLLRYTDGTLHFSLYDREGRLIDYGLAR